MSDVMRFYGQYMAEKDKVNKLKAQVEMLEIEIEALQAENYELAEEVNQFALYCADMARTFLKNLDKKDKHA